MSQSSMLHVRVDDETKEKATLALNAMGLSVSEAVRIFIRRVAADQAFPLELRVPNAETRQAMDEADSIARQKQTRFTSSDALMADLEKTRGR